MIRFNRSASDRAGLSRKASEIHPFDGSSSICHEERMMARIFRVILRAA
jgi:hypothetical protein